MPWLTLVLVALAGAAHAVPALGSAFELRPDRVAEGEGWRLLTGHLAHWSFGHLAWDAGTLLGLGALVERAHPRRLALAYLVTALAVSGAVLLRDDLAAYRGLSGLDVMLFAALAASLNGRARIAWCAALFAKLGYEAVTGATVFVAPDGSGAVLLPEAHWIGALCGFALFARWLPRFSPRAEAPAAGAP